MKKLLFLLLLLPAMVFASDAAGNPNLDAIAKALSTGDVETLSKYFADNVDISIQDNEQILSKADASTALRNFFNTNKPKSFSQVHSGTSRENTDQYCIGNMSTSSGSYRVYIYLKTSGANLTIKEIRFDKE